MDNETQRDRCKTTAFKLGILHQKVQIRGKKKEKKKYEYSFLAENYFSPSRIRLQKDTLASQKKSN